MVHLIVDFDLRDAIIIFFFFQRTRQSIDGSISLRLLAAAPGRPVPFLAPKPRTKYSVLVTYPYGIPLRTQQPFICV